MLSLNECVAPLALRGFILVPLRVEVHHLVARYSATVVQVGQLSRQTCQLSPQLSHPERQLGATGAFTFIFIRRGVIKTPHGGTYGALLVILRVPCATKPADGAAS